MSRLRSSASGKMFMCPGCREMHVVTIVPDGARPCWSWSGSDDRPTFSPSILVTWSEPSDVPEEFDDESRDRQMRCHSFVRDGRIEFLSDCTHALAGQTVELPEVGDD